MIHARITSYNVCYTKLLRQEIRKNLRRVFVKMRGSPAWWQDRCNELKFIDEAMGPAHFFITLSAAEYHWADLHEYLKVKNSDLDEYIKRDLNALLAADPTSVMDFYLHRFDNLMTNILRVDTGEAGALGIVDNYWARVEFQARGAPHIHMKVWIKDVV